MTLPICTVYDSGGLRNPLVSEKEKNPVREENLDISTASHTIYCAIPWPGNRTVFYTMIHSLFLAMVIKWSGFQKCGEVDVTRLLDFSRLCKQGSCLTYVNVSREEVTSMIFPVFSLTGSLCTFKVENPGITGLFKGEKYLHFLNLSDEII